MKSFYHVSLSFYEMDWWTVKLFHRKWDNSTECDMIWCIMKWNMRHIFNFFYYMGWFIVTVDRGDCCYSKSPYWMAVLLKLSFKKFLAFNWKWSKAPLCWHMSLWAIWVEFSSKPVRQNVNEDDAPDVYWKCSLWLGLSQSRRVLICSYMSVPQL